MNRKKIDELLAEIKGMQVMVLGDLMLDKYLYGSVDRISPEAPVPVLLVEGRSMLPGGAANAARSIVSLGGASCLVGCIGDDPTGERLKKAMETAGIHCNGVVADKSRATTIKSRVIAQNQQILRIDKEVRQPINSVMEDALTKIIKDMAVNSSALLISDYAKGLVTPRLARTAIEIFQEKKKPIIVDSKHYDLARFIGVTMVAPNILEAQLATGIVIDSEDALLIAGQKLINSLSCEAALITRGEKGMSLFWQGRHFGIPAIHSQVFDVTGAGDTVAASLSLLLAAGADPLEAALIANIAAGVVVRKSGAAAVSPREVAELASEWQCSYLEG